MRFTIIAVGTRGDLQPAIALGKALQRQDHQVRIYAGANFRGWIEQHGLESAPATVDLQKLMASEGGREWVQRGHNPLVQTRLMKKLLASYGWEMVSGAWEACRGADAVVSSFTSDTYVTAMAEKLDIPQITMPLQPAMIATREGRAIPNAPLPTRRSIVNYLFSRLFIESYPWQLYGDLTVRLRQELNLAPQSAKENRTARQSLLTLEAFSRHVVPRPAEWPANVHRTGYWFLEDLQDWQPPGALLDFLEAGPRPVYVGFGSMTGEDPHETSRLVLRALEMTGQRAVMLSGWSGLDDVTASARVFQLASAPHGWLFPRMAAVVHHGGAGTTAAGLRAGVPSVIIPHFVDQPFWGQRIYDLGVGPKPVPRHKLTAEKLAEAISMAGSDERLREKAAELGRLISAEEGVHAAVGLIESQLQLTVPPESRPPAGQNSPLGPATF